MALSHVCMSCGLDLARVRARIEPHYGLPIVVCPDCGWTAVRRRPRAWRSFRRTLLSVSVLIGQIGLLSLVLAGLVQVCIAVADPSFGDTPRRELAAWLVAYAGFAVVLGVWLTVGLGHIRRVTAWVVFGCLGLVVTPLGALADGRFDMLPARWTAVAIIMTVAVAGIPAGVLLRAGWRHVEYASWRMRRRRRRARSAGR